MLWVEAPKCSSDSERFIKKKQHNEHQNLLNAIYDQDWSVNLQSGSLIRVDGNDTLFHINN